MEEIQKKGLGKCWTLFDGHNERTNGFKSLNSDVDI